MRKLKEVDVDALMPSPECPTDQLQKVKLALPEVWKIFALLCPNTQPRKKKLRLLQSDKFLWMYSI